MAALDISRLLVDMGSSVEIIFANNTFNQMKFSRKRLQPSETPLSGLRGKMVDIFGIALPV